jgi:mRNA-degrading endonuclease RelE of RelBE toxin-antitoxin system
MNLFNVELTDDFKRDAKKLIKKYRSIASEIRDLVESLETDPIQGEPLGKDCYKIRMAIASKNKGKSGGSRVITCVKIIDENVILLSIYDKSEQEDIEDKALDNLLKNNDLL